MFTTFPTASDATAASDLFDSNQALAADLTGDDKLDIFVVNENAKNQLFRGDGTGGFVAMTEAEAGNAVDK
eukprot:6219848-Pyramimonas_sp.AAC.1